MFVSEAASAIELNFFISLLVFISICITVLDLIFTKGICVLVSGTSFP